MSDVQHMTLLATGFHPHLPEHIYHRDPAEQPSLSSSIARLILERSAWHAWQAHSRLNPHWQPDDEPSNVMDMGTACHRLLLEGDAGRERIVVVEAGDWKTKAAQQARAVARAADLVALLPHTMAQAEAIVTAARAQLKGTELAGILKGGDTELTGIWREEDGVYSRARYDWAAPDRRLIADLKITSTSAQPQAFIRRILDGGLDIQDAHYRRGIEHLCGERPRFAFIVVESDPPFALSMIALDPGWQDLANRKLEMARSTWRKCMEKGTWPGYASRVIHASCPPWHEAQLMERELIRGNEPLL